MPSAHPLVLYPNIDLGRPITWNDIVAPGVQPIMDPDDGSVYCYNCQGGPAGDQADLTPLRSSTGVFTNNVLCQHDAPVYLCLGCLPFDSNRPVFTQAVVEELKAAQRRINQRGER